MFIIDEGGCLVGFSYWEADPLYTPVVALYVDNLMVAHAICDLPPQSSLLSGPSGRYWFRLETTVELIERLELGDPSVKLLRLEDAASIRRHAPYGTLVTQSIYRVEDFLTNAERPATRLNGFPKFLTAPFSHQLDVMFIDILGRHPDPGARLEYLPRLQRGGAALDIRNILMSAEEFRNRRLTIADRVGSLITSSLWTVFAQSEPLGERRPSFRQIRLSDYASLSDLDFAIAAHRDCHGDDPSEAAAEDLSGVAATTDRRQVIDLLRRDAATGGRFFDLVD